MMLDKIPPEAKEAQGEGHIVVITDVDGSKWFQE